MGSRKADILVAGDGNDQLNGGLGNDKLTGGAGRDVFAFTTKLGRTNVDRVLDFHAEDDTIFLSAQDPGDRRRLPGVLSTPRPDAGGSPAFPGDMPSADDRMCL